MIYFVVVAILFITEFLYFRVASQKKIVDVPNARSSHSQMVLRGGGVVIPISMIVWAALLAMLGGGKTVMAYLPFLIGLLLIAGVSLRDDVHPLSVGVRLVVHLLAMLLMFDCWGILSWENWWMVALGLIVCVGVINAYNFMDGINGICGGYTLSLLFPMLWINRELDFAPQSLIYVALLAVLVFCFFNFRPKGKAKCFAGDVGSVGSAFIVVFLLGRLMLKTGDFTYIVFLAVYGVDTVLTICHKIMLHEPLSKPHRKHAYQLMANELGVEHTLVSGFYMLLQLAICAGMILIPATPAWHWGYLAGVLLVLCVAYVLFMKKYYHLHEEYLASLKK